MYAAIGLHEFSYMMMGFGSDGANVMVGSTGGVVASLHQKQSVLQGIHCFADRLEHACAQSQLVVCESQ